jgi:pectate lyase
MSGNDGGGAGGSGPGPTGLRAFPGAEGFGALATGGRGGRVIKVTTLEPTGAGSLQEALSQNEARIIVFAVSGVIAGDFEIEYGNVTIAGQSAPGAGITIVGRLSGAYEYGVDNMIIRHIRVRPIYDGSAGQQFDAMQFSRNSRIILDHVSASFAVDETVDLYESKDVTVQWSTIESSATQGHPEGEHNYGLISGPDGRRVSVHHNLFAHHKNRAPAIANGPAEVLNNVMYNVRHGFIHHNPASGVFNLVGNYFKKGGNDMLIPFYFDDEDSFAAADLRYYLADNYIDDPGSSCKGKVNNPWTECDQDLLAPASLRVDSEFSMAGDYWAPVSTQSSEEAYDKVLAGAGAFPRDLVTRQSVAQTRDRSGSWGSYALPNPLDGLTPTAAPEDADNDGIADAWEASHGLSSSDASDNQKEMSSGYPAIEAYLNELADQLVP